MTPMRRRTDKIARQSDMTFKNHEVDNLIGQPVHGVTRTMSFSRENENSDGGVS